MEYITSRFIEEARENIEVLYREDDGKVIAVVCQATESDAQYRKLLEHTTLDDIHENTYKWIRDNRAQVEDEIIEIARKRGMIVDVESGLNTEAFKLFLNALFQEFDPVEQKEELFLLKLEIFELPFVKSCKKRALKSKLRKATTTLDTIKAAIEIFETMQTSSSPSDSD